MKQAVLFNLMGTGVVVGAVILHIICLATPYYSEADMDKIQQLAQSQMGSQNVPSVKDSEPSIPSDSGNSDWEPPSESIQSIQYPDVGMDSSQDEPVEETHYSSADAGGMSAAISGKVNYGMWKFCLNVKDTMSMCMDWGSQFATDPETGTVTTFRAPDWVYGVQAMAIIGALGAGLGSALAVLNLVTESKGDRLRFMYLIIAGTCVAGGVFTLIGDFIMAAKYTSIVDLMMGMDPSSPSQLPPKFVSFIKDQFFLSWGFALDIVSAALAFLGAVAHVIGAHAALNSNGVV